MTICTIPAVYRGGVIRPQVKLDLPDDTLLQIQITTVQTARPSGGSLFGAFPQLATLGSEDLDWARRLWEHGVEKQSRLLDELSPQ